MLLDSRAGPACYPVRYPALFYTRLFPFKYLSEREDLNLRPLVSQIRRFQASEFTAEMAPDDSTNPGPEFSSCTAPIPASVLATNGDGTSGTVELIRGKIDQVHIDLDIHPPPPHQSDRLLDRLLADRADWLGYGPDRLGDSSARFHRDRHARLGEELL